MDGDAHGKDSRFRDAQKCGSDDLQRRMSEVDRLLRLHRGPEGRARIIGVTKKQDLECIRNAYRSGLRDVGENYVQEALAKQDALKSDCPDLRWHFIGQLQSNKAKMVVGRFALIHSVDSLRLAQILSRVAVQRQVVQSVLLEVNIANEATKSGFSPDALGRDLIHELASLPGLTLCGLMSFPPLPISDEDRQASRHYFRQTKALLHACQEVLRERGRQIETFVELSMGTSSDYQEAIEEGATLLRLGTTLFGARD